MKQQATRKLVRAVLIAAVLVIALVSGGALDKSGCADAKSCDEAMTDYFNADSTYYIARLSYFEGEPTTCQDECAIAQDIPQCITDCQIRRHTALGDAETALFSAGGATCTPITVDQCANARAMADGCLVQYPYLDYSDMDERLAVYEQYSACYLASKVDSCQ